MQLPKQAQVVIIRSSVASMRVFKWTQSLQLLIHY